LGWLLLNETLNSNLFIGGILIICSVLITTFEKK
ncbi:EamA family transporter, partial [Bacillus cereus]|nr:EamA family transporter [Bacillus cereus]